MFVSRYAWPEAVLTWHSNEVRLGRSGPTDALELAGNFVYRLSKYGRRPTNPLYEISSNPPSVLYSQQGKAFILGWGHGVLGL